MPLKYTLESDVDDYVKASLNALVLSNLKTITKSQVCLTI